MNFEQSKKGVPYLATESFARREWRRENIMLKNGKCIEFVGVVHNPETLKISEYKSEIKKVINDSSLLISEGGPEFSTKEVYLNLKLSLQNIWPQKSEEQIDSFIKSAIEEGHTKEGMDFYNEVLSMAAEKKIPVAVIDPVQDMYKGLLLHLKEEDVAKAKSLILFYSILSAGGTLSANKLINFAQRIQNNPPEITDTTTGISRRRFLGLLGGTAAVMGGIDALSSSASTRLDDIKGQHQDPLIHFLYELTDYRNVYIAHQLESLSEEKIEPVNKPFSMVYGGLHLDPIKYYLEHQKERELKFAVYFPFRKISSPEINIYRHTDAGWKITK